MRLQVVAVDLVLQHVNNKIERIDPALRVPVLVLHRMILVKLERNPERFSLLLHLLRKLHYLRRRLLPSAVKVKDLLLRDYIPPFR